MPCHTEGASRAGSFEQARANVETVEKTPTVSTFTTLSFPNWER
jgi:hypothetical protein